MSKEELIQFERRVYQAAAIACSSMPATTSSPTSPGEKNRIKTLAGDRVTIEMSPCDLEKGRLIFRHKDERPAGADARGTPSIPAPLISSLDHRHATARKGPSHANLHVQVGNEAAVARFCR